VLATASWTLTITPYEAFAVAIAALIVLWLVRQTGY
jgi:hypothetical protein